jgi:hypothetical protein
MNRFHPIFFAIATLVMLVSLPFTNASATPLSNAVILIVRHAEKPLEGEGLTPAGQARAQAYVKYFENFRIDGVVRRPDYIFAAADSSRSERPRLTVTPLSTALNIPIDLRFKDKDTDDIAQALSSQPTGKTILIALHHEEVADLLTSLGADPNSLLPGGAWPETAYDWVIELRYDGQGKLIPSKCTRISEHLMPGDAN